MPLLTVLADQLFLGERSTISTDTAATPNRVPGYAKLLMIVQQLVIFFFIYWTYEEYSNNLYFQSYVNAGLQGSGFAIIALSSIGIFSAIAVGLYMKLHQTRMELLSIAAESPSHESSQSTASSDSVLAPHVEQHLINMIRNSSSSTDSASGSMPTLKREEPSGRAQ